MQEIEDGAGNAMTTKLPILDNAGAEVGFAELDPSWMEHEKGAQAVHDTVISYLARQRAGTASTKTRGEMRGGGSKPYRQKGTGRARAGSVRSPIWRGGGTTFGPKPRGYGKRLNKKVQALALRRAFTDRIGEQDVIVIDDLTVNEPKTKEMKTVLNAVGAGEDTLVITAEASREVLLSARNLPRVEVVEPSEVNTYMILLFKKIVITREALEAFGAKRLAKKEKAA